MSATEGVRQLRSSLVALGFSIVEPGSSHPSTTRTVEISIGSIDSDVYTSDGGEHVTVEIDCLITMPEIPTNMAMQVAETIDSLRGGLTYSEPLLSMRLDSVTVSVSVDLRQEINGVVVVEFISG